MSFLDDEFLARWPGPAGGQELFGGVSGTIAIKTAGGPGGKMSVGLQFEEGVLRCATRGADRDADITLEAPWQLAADVVCGDADPAVHYMTGDLKVSGDMAMWLKLLSAWRSAGTLAMPG